MGIFSNQLIHRSSTIICTQYATLPYNIEIVSRSQITTACYDVIPPSLCKLRMKSASNHGDASSAVQCSAASHYIRTDVHYHHRAPTGGRHDGRPAGCSCPDNILICCSSTLKRSPPMTHLGTMLHFQLPTSSIITRPAASSDGLTPHPTVRPPTVLSLLAISREWKPSSRWLASDPSLTVAHPISRVTDVTDTRPSAYKHASEFAVP